ncbi:MAG TPA: ABC transporter substrate-binding protein [Halococcus sp.]|nr:ABC transporter substrate-binding protein [Halococcus sp.]
MSDEQQIMNRRQVLAGLGAAGATALAGCAGVAESSSTDTLRVATLRPPVILDPIELNGIGSAQVAGAIFAGLYSYGERATTVPQLATGKPRVTEDGTVYECTLEPNARFQNDQPVTPEDVKYSFEAPVEEDTANAGDVEMIERIEAVGDRTLRFHLKYPYPAFEHTLTRAIVPKSVREAKGDGFGEDPVGAGPFELESFSPETKATVSRWDDYWGELKPDISTLTMLHVESPITRITSLIIGQNTMLEPVPSRLWNFLETRDNISVAAKPGYTSYFVGFNCHEGPTEHRKVRKAIDYCLDMDEAVEQFVGQSGRRAYSPLPPKLAAEWNFPTEKWQAIPKTKNLGRAKELFSTADFSNWKPQILIPKDPAREAIANAIVKGLHQAGFANASISQFKWGSFLEARLTGIPSKYDMYIGGWAAPPDPDSYLYPLVHENQVGKTHGLFYNNDEVMTELQQARQTRNRKRRKRLYESAITTVLEDRALLPAFSRKNSFAIKDKVRDFRVHPLAEVNPWLVSQNHNVSIN